MSEPNQAHPALLLALASHIARALIASLALAVGTTLILSANGTDWETILRTDAYIAAVPFVVVGIIELVELGARVNKARWHYVLANAEAVAEIITGKDLNNSGKVGDVIADYLALPDGGIIRTEPGSSLPDAAPVVEHHLVNSNKPHDVIPVEVEGERVNVAIADLQTVVIEGELTRTFWLGENDSEPRAPFDEQDNRRGYYDAMMLILDKAGQTRRGANNARTLKYSPAATLANLEIPIK